MTGKELGYIAQAHAQRPPRRRRAVHQAVQRVARAARSAAARRCSRTRAPPRSRWRRSCATSGRATRSSCRRTRSSRPPTRSSCAAACPVFVDIRPDTLNIDETLIEAAITPRTRAIVAGALRRRRLRDGRDHGRSPRRHDLLVIEDAAQGLMSTYQRPAARRASATWRRCQLPRDQERHLAARAARCSSTTRASIERAEIIREKGTNRSQFFRGQVDKYTWVRHRLVVPARRDRRGVPLGADGGGRRDHRAPARDLADATTSAFAALEARRHACGGRSFPADCAHNAHMYYLLLPDLERQRPRFIEQPRRRGGIHAVFHYVPLHSSPAGRRSAAPAGRGARPTTPAIASCACRCGSASRSIRQGDRSRGRGHRRGPRRLGRRALPVRPMISIVIPAYRSRDSLPILIERIRDGPVRAGARVRGRRRRRLQPRRHLGGF